MTTNKKPGTDLEQVVAKGRLVIKNPSWSIKDLAEAVTDPLPDLTVSDDMIPFPDPPKPVEMTAKVKDALALLPTLFGTVEMTERRAWDDGELAKGFALDEVLTVLATAIKAEQAMVREGVRTTMDVRAEEAGIAVPKAVKAKNGTVIVPATLRDKDGHYILAAPQKPERLPIPGSGEEWSREFTKGSLSVSAAELDRLHAEGEVSREDYLSMTVAKRVYDEHKTILAINTKNERAAIIAKMTSRTAPSTSLTHRKAK